MILIINYSSYMAAIASSSADLLLAHDHRVGRVPGGPETCCVSLSLSLSVYVYIYIYVYTCII